MAALYPIDNRTLKVLEGHHAYTCLSEESTRGTDQ